MTTYNNEYDRFIQSQKAAELGLTKDLIRDYGASGSANTYTGSMTAGSNVLTIPGPLSSPPDFQVGQGIVVPHAGGGPWQNGSTTALLEAPTGLSIATTGTVGAGYTYEYYVVAINERGGISGLSAPVSVTITESALSQSVYNTITVDEVTGASTYGLFGAMTNPVGSQGYLSSVNPGNSTVPIYDRGPANWFATQQPSWMPDYSLIPAAGLGDFLVTTVVAGAGTQSLVLSSTAVSSTLSGAIVEHNDEAIVNAAIADCNANGYALYAPPGTYKTFNGITGLNSPAYYMGTTIPMGASLTNFMLYGDPNLSVFQLCAGSIQNVLQFGTSANVTFRDFVVDGNWSEQVWNSWYEFQGNGLAIMGTSATSPSTNIKTFRVTGRNTGQSGIRYGAYAMEGLPAGYVYGVDGGRIVDCDTLNNHDQGVAVWSCNDVQVLSSTSDGQCYAGFSLTFSTKCYVGAGSISRNQCWTMTQNKQSGNHHGYGAEIESGYGNIIEDCVFPNNQHAGVFVHNWFGSQTAAYVHAVRNNTIIYDDSNAPLMQPTGVFLWVPNYGYMSDIDVSGNQVYWSPSIPNTGGWGVVVQYDAGTAGIGFERVTVEDNHFVNPPNNGIYTNAQDGLSARGNTISGCGNPAIQEFNAATGNLYEANNVTNNSNGFFSFASGSTSVARNNPGYNPVGALTSPTVGASPWTYTNSNNVPATLYLSGGTVTEIEQYGTVLGLTAGAFALEPGQSVTVTYTAAPTVALIGA